MINPSLLLQLDAHQVWTEVSLVPHIHIAGNGVGWGGDMLLEHTVPLVREPVSKVALAAVTCTIRHNCLLGDLCLGNKPDVATQEPGEGLGFPPRCPWPQALSVNCCDQPGVNQGRSAGLFEMGCSYRDAGG